MAMVVATQAIYFLSTRPGRASSQRLLRIWTWTFVLVVPIAVHAARAGDSQIQWIGPTTASSLLGVGYRLTGGRVMFYISVAAVIATSFFAIRRRSTRDGRAALLIVVGIAAPVILGLVASAAITPLVIDRYYIECVPMIALALSMAVWRLPRGAVSFVALAVVVSGSIVGVADWYHETSWQDWRSASSYVGNLPDPNVKIINTFQSQALRYYLERDGTATGDRFLAQPAVCQQFSGPPCIGGAPDIILITPRTDINGDADRQALARSGYVAGLTRQFAGPILVTRYRRP
jgi:hypothetical protein